MKRGIFATLGWGESRGGAAPDEEHGKPPNSSSSRWVSEFLGAPSEPVSLQRDLLGSRSAAWSPFPWRCTLVRTDPAPPE